MPPEYEKFVRDLDDILYHAEYTVSGTMIGDDLVLDVAYTGSDNASLMPVIQLTKELAWDDVHWIAVPHLSFPDLVQGDRDYYDTIEHWLKIWYQVGRYISQINDYWFDPDGYLADLADEYED